MIVTGLAVCALSGMLARMHLCMGLGVDVHAGAGWRNSSGCCCRAASAIAGMVVTM